ncbi:NIF family HAD-type phosphatase [Stenotrophomonas sp.]|uniref:NIF family HAD-type phosphatase n=1 Tax=Stenotrophomonas sp. TaxID=69392 RepID=UPI0028A6E319|nr:NIF family HAD-type phosphatase [Stenotrophomonas sp.]
MRPAILALDLEGTLISNAVSQIPRPGLRQFLESVRAEFDQLVMFTTVPEARVRPIARLLVEEGHAPGWFRDLAYIRWTGSTKDLRLVSAELGNALLLDDHRSYVHPGQEAYWIEAPHFAAPYAQEDTGLREALALIKQYLSPSRPISERP